MNLKEYAEKIEKAALSVSFYYDEREVFSDAMFHRPSLRANTSLATLVERRRLRSIPRLSLLG